MGWFDNEDEVPVELDCRCPEKDGVKPHDKDTVFLYPTLTPEGGLAGEAFLATLGEGAVPTVGVLIGQLGTLFLQHGIARWTFLDLDANGDYQKVPCNARNIALFARSWERAKPVAEKANDLYGEQMMAPLLARLPKPSRRGPTGASTSPKRSTSAKPRRRSRPSTTATTRPSLQVIQSSDGDSSTSPKKRSAVG